jgi:hypothetical protein
VRAAVPTPQLLDLRRRRPSPQIPRNKARWAVAAFIKLCPTGRLAGTAQNSRVGLPATWHQPEVAPSTSSRSLADTIPITSPPTTTGRWRTP